MSGNAKGNLKRAILVVLTIGFAGPVLGGLVFYAFYIVSWLPAFFSDPDAGIGFADALKMLRVVLMVAAMLGIVLALVCGLPCAIRVLRTGTFERGFALKVALLAQFPFAVIMGLYYEGAVADAFRMTMLTTVISLFTAFLAHWLLKRFHVIGAQAA